MLRVVFDDEFLGGLAQVPQKPFGPFATLHHAPSHGRQVAQRIVAAAALELVAEGGGPVLRPHLPTVNVQRGPAHIGAFARAEFAQQLADELLEMRVQRGFVELVALQPQAGCGRGTRVRTGAGATQTQNRPVARRRRPSQLALRVQVIAEIENCSRGDGSTGGQRGKIRRRRNERFDARHGGKRIAHVKRFVINVGNALVARGCREREHRHITVKLILRLEQLRRQAAGAEVRLARQRARQHRVEVRRPGDFDRAGDEVLHGLLRLDPRSAAAGPAGPGVEGDLQAEPFRLGDNVFEKLPPFGAHEFHRPLRNADIYFHDHHATDAGALHRFEVGREAFAAQVAVHPHPIDPRPGGRRRVGKTTFKRAPARWQDRHGEAQQGGQQGELASRSFGFCFQAKNSANARCHNACIPALEPWSGARLNGRNRKQQLLGSPEPCRCTNARLHGCDSTPAANLGKIGLNLAGGFRIKRPGKARPCAFANGAGWAHQAVAGIEQKYFRPRRNGSTEGE